MQNQKFLFKSSFKVAIGNRRAQSAEMVLSPGSSEGGGDNRHRGSDQWLFVVGGSGIAIIEDKQHKLKKGTLILIERGETHEIKNTGRRPLKTLNIYVPPAYKKDGEPQPRGQS